MHQYLLVIDMQNDFISGSLGTKEAQAIVPRVVSLLEDAKAQGRTPLFSQDTHSEDYLDTSEGRHLPIVHCVEGTEGWQLASAIAPYAHETIKKPTFGFLELVDLFRVVSKDDGANLDIAICGLCTDICVVTNALILRTAFPEAEISVHSDACAGVTPSRHEAALEVMRSCQIEVR